MTGISSLHEGGVIELPNVGKDRSNEFVCWLAGLREFLVEDDPHTISEAHQNVYALRDHGNKRFAWAIPTKEALQEIRLQCKTWGVKSILSIGSGTGYWEHLLSQMGKTDGLLPVQCWDEHPPAEEGENPYGHETQYHPVGQGTPHDAHVQARLRQRDIALFLCWPPYNEPMAHDCLKQFGGRVLIFIGEGRGGCTADHAFYDLLDRDWQQVSEVDLPQWFGIRDWLSIWIPKTRSR